MSPLMSSVGKARSLRVLVALWLLAGCGAEEAVEATDTRAHAFDGDECAACGMIVREQPSPRGQLVHRDGTRIYACSLADLHVYAAAPSSHGEAVAAYVEALPVDADPGVHSTAPERWVPAEEASYVLGVERGGVMGQPVLAYATRGEAERAAARLGGHVVDHAGLRRELDDDLR